MRRLFLPMTVLILTLPAAALAAPGTLMRVSDTSPLAGRCAPNDRTLLYGAAEGLEEEVAFAVDPADPQRMVVAWTADLGLGIVAASTDDGGRSWQHTVVPGVGACAGGDHDRVIHPRPSFGPDGTVYLMTHPLDGFWPDPRSAVAHIAVSRSTDGGRTWDPPAILDAPTQPAFNDLGGLAAEPDVPGAAVAVWSHPEVVLDGLLLSRTVDHGETWTTTTVRTPTPASLVGKTVVAHPDGTLLLFVSDEPLDSFFGAPLREAPISVLRSVDKGRTWSDPIGITADGDGLFWPTAAVAPDGATHLVWGDATEDGRLALRMRSSPDSGLTWGPVRDVTTIDAGQHPSIVAGPRGLIGLAYYEVTDEGRAVWLARSGDGGARWTTRRLTTPFAEAALQHPVVGDVPVVYQLGLALDGSRLRTAFVGSGHLAEDGLTDVWTVTADARR